MYTFASGSPRTFAGPPSAGFGAVAPAAARGPIRLSEIAAALKMPAAAHPTIKGLLYSAQAAVSQMTEATVSQGEHLYMQAHAQAKIMQSPIPLLRDLSVTAAPAGAPADVTKAITSITDAITSVAKTTLIPGRAPAPTSPVDFRSAPPPLVQDLRSTLEQPIGPLPLWQWVAVGGVGLTVLGVALKMMRFAVLGGLAAAGAYTAVEVARRQRARAGSGD